MITPMGIEVRPENCSGCLRCCLACSFFNTDERVFSLSKSNITVRPDWGETLFTIEFSDECLSCGICADYCDFGALT